MSANSLEVSFLLGLAPCYFRLPQLLTTMKIPIKRPLSDVIWFSFANMANPLHFLDVILLLNGPVPQFSIGNTVGLLHLRQCYLTESTSTSRGARSHYWNSERDFPINVRHLENARMDLSSEREARHE